MRIRELIEADIIDFAKATDPANVPVDRVNKMLQRIGISDFGVIINKPFDEKIYEVMIDAYMNGLFSSTMENKTLRYVLDIYRKRGVKAKKLPPERPSPTPESKECGPGEYFCGKSQKCLPIPKGHKVRSDGYLIKEKQKLSDKPCPACGDPACDHKQQHMTEMQTTDYVDTDSFFKHVKQFMDYDGDGKPEPEYQRIGTILGATMQAYQDKSQDIFYEVEEEKGGYIVQGKPFPDFVSAVEYAKRKRLPGGSVQSVWNWREDPKGYTQHPDMIRLKEFIKDKLQQVLDSANIPIYIIHMDQDDEMAPQFRLNLNTNEGTRCWKGYKKKGMKTMFGKRVPNCVKNESEEKFITHRELASIIYKYTKNLQLARDFDNLEDEFVSQDDMQSSFLSSMDNDSLEFDRERVNKILGMHKVPVKVIKMKQDDQFNTLYSILQTVATNEGEVVGMNPQAKKPFFSPEEADRANDEWVNQAQVDQEDGVIVRGTDDKQYRIMTSYNNEHFEDGEVYLDGLTDPTYIDLEGYPDAAELLYYHSATGHYPEDEDYEVIERNLNPAVADYIEGKKTKLIKVNVADLDDEAIDDRFGRVIGDPDPDVGVDLDDPILLDKDGKTILDGFHRVYQAKRVGRDVIPAHIIDENFKDGKVKGKSRPGRVKRAGASCKGSVTSLRKKAKNSSGEKAKMYHWCANMKSGRKKS